MPDRCLKVGFFLVLLLAGCSRSDTPPAVELDEISWDDRSIFEDLLVEEELAMHPELREASIYKIDLKIDDSLSDLYGTMKVLYTNGEDFPLESIIFTLFPNLTSGSMDISALKAGGLDAEPEYRNRRSSLILRLPKPLSPGEKIEIEVEYFLKVPHDTDGIYGGLSYGDDYLSLAYCYPQIPSMESWDNSLPLSYGDFICNEVSFYLVEVDIPSSLVLAAPGIEVGRRKKGDRTEVSFVMGPARDLYMAASSKFVRKAGQVGKTQVLSYAAQEADKASDLALSAAITALDIFNHRFGTYPFTTFTVVSVPLAAFGMEFPGIIINAARLYDLGYRYHGIPANILLESTVAHEAAHQWFYGTVGNDQLNEPWLDEALAQYATWLYYRDRYGDTASQGIFQSFLDRWKRVEREPIPIGLPVSKYSVKEYGAIIYGRAPLFIKALSDEMAERVFDKFLEELCREYRWEMVCTKEFKDLAERLCRCSLDDLFAAWVYE